MYTKSYGQFFVPAGSAALDAEDLTGAAAVHGQMICVKKCVIKRIFFGISTAIVSNVDVTVELNKRPTIGSATAESQLGEINLGQTTAVGLYFKDVTPVIIEPGQAVAFEHTVQAAGGGAAGAGVYGFEFEDMPEEDTNLSSMTESS